MQKLALLLFVLVVAGGCGDGEDAKTAGPAVAAADGAAGGDGSSAGSADAAVPAGDDGSAGAADAAAPCPTPRLTALFRFPIDISGEGCAPGDDCGILPNGPSLNGTAIEESTLESVAYAGMVAADGRKADVASLKDGELLARAADAVLPAEGLIMRGTHATLDGPRPVRLRIENVQKDGALISYDVSYENLGPAGGGLGCDAGAGVGGGVGANDRWRPVCSNTASGQGEQRGRAFFVNAVWNYGAGKTGDGARSESATDFTIACLDTSAIAKCIQIGYVPWKPRPDAPDRLLADHHQACVRAVRADFCSNGFPLTEAGTLIRLYDTLPVLPKRVDAKGEASWNPAGALCISQTRLATLVDTQGTTRTFSVKDYIERVCPGKFTATGRPPWGGACIVHMLPDSEQVFTEIPEKAPVAP